MKKVFETPAIEIFRMQVSEDLTFSGSNYDDILVNGVKMFKARTFVGEWTD